MRSDAANLLSRLGQTKFRYQEFSDNFADMELWPLFEALIRDERISGNAALVQAATPAPAHVLGQVPVAVPAAVPVSGGHASAPADTRTGLFGRYGDAAPAIPDRTPDPASKDIRSLLRELNNRVGQRDL